MLGNTQIKHFIIKRLYVRVNQARYEFGPFCKQKLLERWKMTKLKKKAKCYDEGKAIPNEDIINNYTTESD